jgi:cyanophycinase
MKLRILILLSLLALMISKTARAQESPSKLLVPIGGGYAETLDDFVKTAMARSLDETVSILVLPISFASNPDQISAEERKQDLRDAETRRAQIEQVCQRLAQPGVRCSVELAPVLVHADAEDSAMQKFFTPTLDAVFILGGDQMVAMQVINNTPFETRLIDAYTQGVLVGGTSAGAAVEAATMLGGYTPGYDAASSLDFGAVDLWIPPARHGLTFGLSTAVIDQHFFQRGRPGRLLNTISMPAVPQVGIGLDAYTGVHISDNKTLRDVFGLYNITILDAQTYHAADAVQYHGPFNSLSLRNVLVQMLAPGTYSYDLETRRHSLSDPPERIERSFDALSLPEGAGALMLSGDLGNNPDNELLTRFANLSGGGKAKILIVMAGYPNSSTASQVAAALSNGLRVATQVTILQGADSEPLEIPEDVTGILVAGDDVVSIQPEQLSGVRAAWASGKPVMMVGAASAIAGRFYANNSPTPNEADQTEAATEQSFIKGMTAIKSGLGMLGINIEPRLLEENRWGRLFSLAYMHPENLAFGLTTNSALELTPKGASAQGERSIISLDLSRAALDTGSNQGFIIANGLLDVFSPGDLVQAETANINSAPLRLPTPAHVALLPTPAETAWIPTEAPAELIPTVTSWPSATPKPTREPKLTPTPRQPHATPAPPVIPPTTDPQLMDLLSLVALILVMILLFAIWINRGRLKLR